MVICSAGEILGVGLTSNIIFLTFMSSNKLVCCYVDKKIIMHGEYIILWLLYTHIIYVKKYQLLLYSAHLNGQSNNNKK